MLRPLLRPFHVIVSRPISRGLLNKEFQDGPKVNLLQRPVEPTGGYAEVSFMRCNMMHSMMPPWQDYSVLLEPNHVPRQTKVSVRPFVNLSKRKIIQMR